jgi:hypothetical protein
MPHCTEAWSTCRRCGRSIELLHWITGLTNWYHVESAGNPVVVLCVADPGPDTGIT